MFHLLSFKVFKRSEAETILTKTFKWYIYILAFMYKHSAHHICTNVYTNTLRIIKLFTKHNQFCLENRAILYSKVFPSQHLDYCVVLKHISIMIQEVMP